MRDRCSFVKREGLWPRRLVEDFRRRLSRLPRPAHFVRVGRRDEGGEPAEREADAAEVGGRRGCAIGRVGGVANLSEPSVIVTLSARLSRHATAACTHAPPRARRRGPVGSRFSIASGAQRAGPGPGHTHTWSQSTTKDGSIIHTHTHARGHNVILFSRRCEPGS